MASCAQRLLEHSLLTELQGVVARTLQGVDMFSQTQLAGILGHSHRLQDAESESSEVQTQVWLMYSSIASMHVQEHVLCMCRKAVVELSCGNLLYSSASVQCCQQLCDGATKLLFGWLAWCCTHPSFEALEGSLDEW